MQSGSHIDIPFQVTFVHRLRFTQDVFGDDSQILADLLEPSENGPARVQFWIDQNLLTAQPTLPAKIEAFCAGDADRFQPVGTAEHVPGGEAIKNDIHVLERMLKSMHAADLDRRSYVVAIGGGAVLDAVGFAAAIAHRGLRLVRLPTTTLAQADSGIGVKNSVNLFRKKNWIGTFAVPWAVVNDATLLASLGKRDFLCGFSEAVKVALLKRRSLFERIEQLADAIGRQQLETAWPIIRESAELHLEHITRGGDPFEAHQARPLDFGHWSAHRLEAMSDFRLRHGEAVAIGVAIDSIYSSRMCGLAPSDASRILACLDRLGLIPYDPTLEQVDALMTGIEEFRQHLGGQLTLTMLRGIGQSFEVHHVDSVQMRRSIADVVAFAKNKATT